MNDLEKRISKDFEWYFEAGVAMLSMMPVSKTHAGHYIKKAPFDVYGIWMREGTFIGAELKQSKRKASLPIVMPGNKGDGLQFHQLEALALIAQHNGIARLVWENGGEVGCVGNGVLINAHNGAMDTFAAEKRGLDPIRGAKSISWDRFDAVPFQSLPGCPMPVNDWLGIVS